MHALPCIQCVLPTATRLVGQYIYIRDLYILCMAIDRRPAPRAHWRWRSFDVWNQRHRVSLLSGDHISSVYTRHRIKWYTKTRCQTRGPRLHAVVGYGRCTVRSWMLWTDTPGYIIAPRRSSAVMTRGYVVYFASPEVICAASVFLTVPIMCLMYVWDLTGECSGQERSGCGGVWTSTGSSAWVVDNMQSGRSTCAVAWSDNQWLCLALSYLVS